MKRTLFLTFAILLFSLLSFNSCVKDDICKTCTLITTVKLAKNDSLIGVDHGLPTVYCDKNYEEIKNIDETQINTSFYLEDEDEYIFVTVLRKYECSDD